MGIISALAACYSPPEPDCGFACGPAAACPADYTCAADRVCHRNGAPAGTTCPGRPDAGVDAPSGGPQVLNLDPPMDATGVPVDHTVVMTVDRDLVGVDSSTFYLVGVNGPVAATSQYQMFSLMAEVRPTLQLAPSTQYLVVVGGGISDNNGQPLMPFQWSFTTAPDTVLPHIADTQPFDMETGVLPIESIYVDFDEPVFGVDATSFTVSEGTTLVSGNVNQQGNNYSWGFMPTTLASMTTYTVSLTSAIHDNYGNALAPFSFTFTTQ